MYAERRDGLTSSRGAVGFAGRTCGGLSVISLERGWGRYRDASPHHPEIRPVSPSNEGT
jgi:hypothetical protein